MGLHRRHYTRTGTRRASACQPMTAIGASVLLACLGREGNGSNRRQRRRRRIVCKADWTRRHSGRSLTTLSILLKLDDRAGIKENAVLLSPVIRLNPVQPGRLQARSPDQEARDREREREPRCRRRLGLLPHICSVRDISFLIAFLSGTIRGLVLARPWTNRRHVHILSPPGLLHEPDFTQRALQSTR